MLQLRQLFILLHALVFHMRTGEGYARHCLLMC